MVPCIPFFLYPCIPFSCIHCCLRVTIFKSLSMSVHYRLIGLTLSYQDWIQIPWIEKPTSLSQDHCPSDEWKFLCWGHIIVWKASETVWIFIRHARILLMASTMNRSGRRGYHQSQLSLVVVRGPYSFRVQSSRHGILSLNPRHDQGKRSHFLSVAFHLSQIVPPQVLLHAPSNASFFRLICSVDRNPIYIVPWQVVRDHRHITPCELAHSDCWGTYVGKSLLLEDNPQMLVSFLFVICHHCAHTFHGWIKKVHH